ncbi:unnamed protein product, partial [Brassica rapa]
VALFGYDYTKDVGAGQTNFCLSLILLKLEDYQPPCHLQMELQNREIYSGLTFEKKNLILEFAEVSGVTISRKWEPRVTHVIASTNENGACKRTLKFMMGILEGKWILSIDWIKACMKDREYVSEELYEISIDVHGTRQGPFTGRQRALNKEPKLFSGLKFYNRELGLISLFQEVSKQGLVCSKYCIRSKLQPRNQVHKTILLESNHILCNSIGKRVTYFDHSCSTSVAVI